MTHTATVTRRSRTLRVAWGENNRYCRGTVRQCLEAVPPSAEGILWWIRSGDQYRGAAASAGIRKPKQLVRGPGERGGQHYG